MARARPADAERFPPPGGTECSAVLPRSIGQAVSTWDARGALAVPLGILVLGGLLLQAVRREFAVVVYVVLSLAAMCATPFQKQFVRYLLPLYPLLALALFELLIWATAQARSRWPALPAALGTAIPWLVIVVIALRTASGVRGIYANSHHDVAYEQHGQAVRYRLFYYEPEGADLDAALDWWIAGPRPTTRSPAATRSGSICGRAGDA